MLLRDDYSDVIPKIIPAYTNHPKERESSNRSRLKYPFTNIHTYIHTHMYIHKFIHTDRQTDIQTYIHTP